MKKWGQNLILLKKVIILKDNLKKKLFMIKPIAIKF